MASIRKRKWTSGGQQQEAWIVDHFDQAGKRHIRTFPKKKDAEAFRDQMAGEVRAGTYTADSKSITIGEAGDDWITQAKADNLERSTIRQYETHLALHIKPFIGSTKLSRLTTPGVHDFERQLREAGRSAVMVRRVVVSLGAIVRNAQAAGKVAQNVVAGISRDGRRKRANKQAGRQKKRLRVGVDFPTKAELRDMLGKVEGRWRPLVVTAIFSGLRSSELRGLTWDHIDFSAKTLTVQQRADQWNEIGAPKSDAGQRTIPLGPMALNTLREWKLICPREGVDEEKKKPGRLHLVFPNGVGKPESHANIVNRGLIPLVEKIGAVTPKLDDKGKPAKDKDGNPIMVAKYTGLHALRHVAASLWIEQGFKPKRLQELMGHSSIQMTFDVYGHLWPNEEEDHKAMSQIETRLLG